MKRVSLALLACIALAACGVPEDPSDGCQLAGPAADSGNLWPNEVSGPTACDDAAPLVPEHTGTPLHVRSASVGQTHCAEILVSFYEGEQWCNFNSDELVATLYFVGNGAGTYEATGDDLTCERGPNGEVIGPPPGQDPYGIEANRDQATTRGTGLVEITSDAGLDTQWTVGTVDVEFDDGTRLLADFTAPLCVTE